VLHSRYPLSLYSSLPSLAAIFPGSFLIPRREGRSSSSSGAFKNHRFQLGASLARASGARSSGRVFFLFFFFLIFIRRSYRHRMLKCPTRASNKPRSRSRSAGGEHERCNELLKPGRKDPPGIGRRCTLFQSGATVIGFESELYARGEAIHSARVCLLFGEIL